MGGEIIPIDGKTIRGSYGEHPNLAKIKGETLFASNNRE
jgi:hypothetical protein